MGKKMNKKIGEAGEYYVASQLLLRGLNASVLQNGSEKCDILVSDPESSIAKTIEVKSTTTLVWTITNFPKNNNLIYVLVYFPYKPENHFSKINYDPPRPEFYILSIDEVRQFWNDKIGIHGKGGIKRSDLKDSNYREQWDKIIDNGKESGYRERRTKRQIRNDKNRSIAFKLANKKARKKNGQFRKGWDNKRVFYYAHKLLSLIHI